MQLYQLSTFGITLISLASAAFVNSAQPEKRASMWSHYPKVERKFVFNGLADRLYNEVSPCVQQCLVDHKDAPNYCPKWDPGCHCVMEKFNNEWAGCVANKCHGKEVVNAEASVNKVCKDVGVDYPKLWYVSDSVQHKLDVAKTRIGPKDI